MILHNKQWLVIMIFAAHLTVSIEVPSKKKKLKSLNAHIHIHLRKFVIFPAIG